MESSVSRPIRSPRPNRSRATHRAGMLYLSVLGISVIVSMMALAGMYVARLQLRTAEMDSDRYRARVLAQSAIEHAIAEFNTNANWATDYAFDTEYPNPAPQVGGGEFVWKRVDVGNGQSRIDGIGRAGAAEAVVSADINFQGDLLQYGLVCHKNILVVAGSNNLTVTGASVCTNASFSNHGTVNADVEAQSNSGTAPTGTLTIPGPIQQFPQPNHLWNTYAALGTVIPNSAIPTGSGSKEIARVVLSPFSNPYGPTDPNGVYVIDSPGMPLKIYDCRIVGTLVVRNPDGVSIHNVNWEPAHPNYPATIVLGELRLHLSGMEVQEATDGVNLNPAGAPSRSVTDTDTSDSYPSSMAGLIYASNNIVFDGNSGVNQIKLQGSVISNGSCKFQQSVTASIEYDPLLASDPPPGFSNGAPPTIGIATWRRTPSN